MFAADRASDILLLDKLFHLLLREGVNWLVQHDTVLSRIILYQLVCTEALMTLLAVHQRV